MPARIKPVKKHPRSHKVYDFHEVMRYLEKKYKFDMYDYRSETTTGYSNFWHWFVDLGDIHNGCYSGLGFDWLDDDKTPEWVKEILRLIQKEFAPKSDIDFWVEW